MLRECLALDCARVRSEMAFGPPRLGNAFPSRLVLVLELW